MVNLMIDNIKVAAPNEATIIEAAASAGILIPRLCYLKGINEIGACRVCVVEIEGRDKLFTACNNKVQEGMVIYTNSPKVRKHRKSIVEMILSQHDGNCVTCVRSGNCTLQKVANELNIINIPYEKELEILPWNKEFPIIRDSSKCIKCMRCIQVCDKVQDMKVWDVVGTGSRTSVGITGNRKIEEIDCALCGQCVTHCPVGALRERDDTEKVWNAIAAKDKVTIVQVAPAVRAAWGEELGLSQEEATMGKIVDALRRIGFDHVFDTVFSADLTIMEEGTEFVERFKNNKTKKLPMFTSCCPGWIRFVKAKYPQLISQLSTAKSPQQMFGAVMKTYYAQKLGVSPQNIYTVSIMPCIAKKAESKMELYYEEYAGHDVDFVLTTRELNRMIKTAHIDPETLREAECDEVMKDGSGAGVIFGTTGGVMEAALRSAYYLLTRKNADPDAFRIVRGTGEQGWISAEIEIGVITVKAAVVNGLGNASKLIEALEKGEAQYDFVEVMACPGGCVGGGGQPIHDGAELAAERGKTLYNLDCNAAIRFSHENQDVARLYEEYFVAPLSKKSHMLLHTNHKS
jgi:NADH-quinone oxidoreductase subunit G